MIFRAFLCSAIAVLLLVVWTNTFLPMQDLPQHLFMAWVANNYEDSALDLSEVYLLRQQFGPYRATYLLQRLFSHFMEPTAAARVIVSVYLLLIGVLVLKIRENAGESGAWAGLLLVPAALHPMYFYGFLNFTLSIPVLLLALLQLRSTFTACSIPALMKQSLWVLLLFLIHPYSLLVYIVLLMATVAILVRTSQALGMALSILALSLALFIGWMGFAPADGPSRGLTALFDARMVWWPSQYNLGFLAMMFTGMRFHGGGDWLVMSIWLAAIPVLLFGFYFARSRYRAGWWMPVLAALALAGYFSLPFSVQTDARFTFFSVRMAPIFLFLLLAAVAAVPLHPIAGKVLATVALALTVSTALLHDRVAGEVAEIQPLLTKMESGQNMLPLISRSPSAFLDPVFYAQFHYHGVFYYHLLSGGGRNPDLFNNRLMPVAFRRGQRPSRPSQRELYRWLEHRSEYRYVISRGVDPRIDEQLTRYAGLAASAGGWHLYDLQVPPGR